MSTESAKATRVVKDLFLFGTFTAVATFGTFASAETPQEAYISPKGEFYFSGAVVSRKQAANRLQISIWGVNWNVVADYNATYVSSRGKNIIPADISKGHIVELKGRPSPDVPGAVEALFVRDLSISDGTDSLPITSLVDDALHGKNVTSPQVVLPSSVVTQVPIAAPSALPASPVLSQSQSQLQPQTQSGLQQKTDMGNATSEFGLLHDLKLGMRGAEVIILQTFLQKNNWGIPNNGPVTGVFGKVTTNALAAFQKANNLAATGIADVATRARINGLLSR